jgi:hypothetical protein
MNIREAIATAKQYTMEVFADEKIADLGIEEVVRDDEHGLADHRWILQTSGRGQPINRRYRSRTLDADRRAADVPPP